MSFDLSGVQVLCLVVMLGAVGWLVYLNRPQAAAWTVRQVTSKLPFTMTAEAHERLTRRALRDLRGVGVVAGTAAGLLFVAAPLGLGAASLSAFMGFYVVIMTVHWVAPFQTAAELLLQPAAGVPRGARVARGRVVRVSDFVRPLDLLLVRVTTGATVLLMGVIVVGLVREGDPPSVTVPVAVLGATVLLSAAVVEIASRVAVRRPRPAASEHALMSDDAVTSYGLRTSYTAVASVVWISSNALIVSSAAEDGFPYRPFTVGLWVVVIATYGVASMAQQQDRSVRHFLVRLWGMPKGYFARPPLAPVPAQPGNPYRGGQ